MKWRKYTVYTTTEAEDIISSMLCDLGAEGVQIEDNVPLTEADTKGMFIDILPELPPDDGSSKVSFFLRVGDEACVPEKKPFISEGSEGAGVDASYTVNDRVWTEEEAERLLADIERELSEMREYTDIGEGRIECSETEDVDWMNNWKKFFKPFIVDDILIKPTWEEIPEEYAGRDDVTVIEMDPGTAFGTGSHETTQLCIRQIKKFLKGGERVLDIGTGSGILGIAALKLGADSVTATDLDDNCVDAVCDNLMANMLPAESFRLYIGNVIGDEETESKVGFEAYDLMVANILAPVIELLAARDSADRFLKPGGIFITSGIIEKKADYVVRAFLENHAWEILETNRQGEWVNITARKRA